jgi:hypothetical protein
MCRGWAGTEQWLQVSVQFLGVLRCRGLGQEFLTYGSESSRSSSDWCTESAEGGRGSGCDYENRRYIIIDPKDMQDAMTKLENSRTKHVVVEAEPD